MSAWKIWWRQTGRWGKASTFVVVVTLTLTILYKPLPLGWTSHGETTMNGVTLSLSTKGMLTPGDTFTAKISASRPISVRLSAAREFAPAVVELNLPGQEAVVDLPLANHCGAVEVVAKGPGDQEAVWLLGRPVPCNNPAP